MCQPTGTQAAPKDLPCLIRLRPDAKRKLVDAQSISSQLNRLLGKPEGTVYALSRETLFITAADKDLIKVMKDKLLQQEVVYELECNKEAFRRPGDLPYKEHKQQVMKEAQKTKGGRIKRLAKRIRDRIKRTLGGGGPAVGRRKRKQAIGNKGEL